VRGLSPFRAVLAMKRMNKGALQMIGKSPKIKSSRMKEYKKKGKWLSSDRILSSDVFFLHAFMLKFLAIGFLAQHAKILNEG
jgi:hypothetical protein